MMRPVLRRFVRGFVALGLCMGLQACVTLRQPAPADLALLSAALTEPVEDLSKGADAGQARAQFAMALLHAYGLRGVTLDQPQATLLRRKALAARGFMPITTYIAGLHGKPGRVSTITVPRYDLNAGQALRIEQCAAALARGQDGPAGHHACAGPLEFERISALWGRARTEHP